MDDPPRYQPLRVLPARAYVPGQGERPTVEPQPAAPATSYFSAERWAEHPEYLWGVDLYNTGFYWEAHEVWERLWRAAEHDPQQHAFLQGMIQCAAACLKGVMRDADAARRISARALDRLELVREQSGDTYMGLDLAQLCSAFRSFVARDPSALASRPRLTLCALHAGEDMPAVELPIDGVLDLHTFRPADVRELVQDYLDECRRRGVLAVRIIHGKGNGTLRRTVHAALDRRSDVLEYHLTPPERGGWGATLVTLLPGAPP